MNNYIKYNPIIIDMPSSLPQSFLVKPLDRPTYTKLIHNDCSTVDDFAKYFSSLVFNGVLNTAQIVYSWIQRISIALTWELHREVLTFAEVVSDIVLYQLISWDNDRHLLLTTDDRSNNDRSDNKDLIRSYNCMVFPWGSYTIYDLHFLFVWLNEWELLWLEEWDIFSKIIDNIKELFNNRHLDLTAFENIFDEFWLDWKTGVFFTRMQKKIRELISRYEWILWRELFFHN